MNHENEGFSLSAESMMALGVRGIEIGFDIYALSDDEEESAIK